MSRQTLALFGPILLLFGLAFTGPAEAAIVHLLYESNGTVISQVSGSANLEALQLETLFNRGQPRLNPVSGQFLTGDPAGPDGVDHYRGVFGPARIDNAPSMLFVTPGPPPPGPIAGVGPLVGVFGGSRQIAVPRGYESGDPIFARSVWESEPLVGLPIEPATHVWQWGTGDSFDTYTLLLGVPEPNALLLVVLGFGGSAWVGRGGVASRRA